MSAIHFAYEYWPYLSLALVAVVILGALAYVQRNWHLVVIAGSVIGAVLAVGRAFSKGEASAKARQDLAAKRVIQGIKVTQRKVQAMPAQEVDQELQKWVK